MSAVATPSSPPAATATKTTVMIVEDTPFWQKQIEQALQAAGYATVMAANGAEGLALVEKHKPAVIISDIEMPQMTGLQMLNALRSKPQWQTLPVILLTTGAAKERVIEATRLKAAEYMLKGSFSGDQLADRVKKWLQPRPKAQPAPPKEKAVASAFPRLLQRGEVLSGITAHVSAGKTLGNVITQTIDLCKTSPSNTNPFLEIVKLDPMLAMRVMQAANASKRIGTIEDALKTIDVAAIRAIAESLSPYPGNSRSALAGYQHSLAVASILNKIVPRSFELNVGITYLIGLLHDMPEILLRQAFPSQYEAALDFSDQASKPLRYVAADIFSVTMSDVANEILGLLKLPPMIVTALREYAAASAVMPQSAGRSGPMVDRLALALRFAEYYANALRLPLTSSPSDALIAPLSVAECRAAYVSMDPINGDDIRNNVIASCQKLTGETPAEHVTPSSGRPKIWYTRHNSLAALDPVEEALRRFADVDLQPELPSKREQMSKVNGVVVCAPAFDSFGSLWLLSDRTPQDAGPNRTKVLYVVPSSAPISKRPAGDNIGTLTYPFTLASLESALKTFAS